MLKKIFFIFVAIAACSSLELISGEVIDKPGPGNSSDAVVFLESHFDKVLNVIKKSKKSNVEKQVLVKNIVDDMFDFGLIAKLSLGRTQWHAMSGEEKERFSYVFKSYLLDLYVGNLFLLKHENLFFSEPVVSKRKVTVPMRFSEKKKESDTFIKMYYSKSGWKVYDIEYQGVSILASFQAQFKPLLENDSIETLINSLKL